MRIARAVTLDLKQREQLEQRERGVLFQNRKAYDVVHGATNGGRAYKQGRG